MADSIQELASENLELRNDSATLRELFRSVRGIRGWVAGLKVGDQEFGRVRRDVCRNAPHLIVARLNPPTNSRMTLAGSGTTDDAPDT